MYNWIKYTALALVLTSSTTFASGYIKHPGAVKYFGDKLDYESSLYEINEIVQGKKSGYIVDVRDTGSYAAGHIPGAVNIPDGKVEKDNQLPKDEVIFVYCYNPYCSLATYVAHEWSKKGHKVKEIKGGFKAWEEAKYSIEKGESPK